MTDNSQTDHWKQLADSPGGRRFGERVAPSPEAGVDYGSAALRSHRAGSPQTLETCESPAGQALGLARE